jgi:hypothetical protein
MAGSRTGIRCGLVVANREVEGLNLIERHRQVGDPIRSNPQFGGRRGAEGGAWPKTKRQGAEARRPAKGAGFG